jgi:hypothetical protein
MGKRFVVMTMKHELEDVIVVMTFGLVVVVMLVESNGNDRYTGDRPQ